MSTRPTPPRTVLMDAGPWLPVPPPAYGGLENVVSTLVTALRERGVAVVLAAAEGSTQECEELVVTGEPARAAHRGGRREQRQLLRPTGVDDRRHGAETSGAHPPIGVGGLALWTTRLLRP